MINNDVNNQKKLNNAFNVCRYITVVFGVVVLSTWTVKSAPLVNSTKQVLQQNIYKEITGIVKTEEGDPIPGVVILKVGTTEGTDTDIDGRYSLSANEGDKIQFVYDGFKTTTVTVSKSNILNITMIEDVIDLSDIVVDKYRTISKETIGCVGLTYNSKTIEAEPRAESVFPELMDKGRPFIQLFHSPIISLNITKYSDPSERNPETLLKDVENLTRNGNYTYIVDGVRVSEETFRALNQNDIESVDVFKHTDVYNARFGNKDNQSRISLNAR